MESSGPLPLLMAMVDEPWLAVDVWLVLLSFAPLLILALAYASFDSLEASSL